LAPGWISTFLFRGRGQFYTLFNATGQRETAHSSKMAFILDGQAILE